MEINHNMDSLDINKKKHDSNYSMMELIYKLVTKKMQSEELQ